MAYAKGKYLMFLDADDLYNQDFFEKMVNKAEDNNADVVICSFTRSNLKNKTTAKNEGLKIKKTTDDEVINPKDIDDLYAISIGASWNKLYRRDMVEKNDLHFPNFFFP